MPMSPDEIAQRSFTPSADGYHKGEVREFLRRIAGERAALLTTQPDGQVQAAETTVALEAHEERLMDLERRLAHTAAELAAVVEALRTSQDRTSQQLAAARKLTADQQAIADRLAGGDGGAGGAGQRSTATRRPATTTITTSATGSSAAASASRPSVLPPRPPAAPNSSASYRGVGATGAAPPPDPQPRRTPGTDLPPPLRSGTIPPAQADPGQTNRQPNRSSIPPAPLTPGQLDDDSPLISDNANQLLDGVLDDVLGNLNEGPDQR